MVECKDINCPVHGELSTRGMILDGIVTSDKMNKTVVVTREYHVKSKKFERYLLKRSKISAHNPPCIGAKVGDRVRIAECRKLSKNKSFVVVEKLKDTNERSKKQ